MLSEWIREIAYWIADLGYLGAFLAGFGFFPTNTLSIVLGAARSDSILQMAIVGGIGAIFGSSAMYFLGYHFRNRDLLKFLNGKGKFLHISEGSYNDADKYLEKWGFLFIFFSRFIPAVRIVTPIIAGYLKHSFKYIPLAVFLATTIHIYILMYLGSRLGLNWDNIKSFLDIFNNAILIVLGIGILVYVYIKRKKYFGSEKYS